MRSVPACRQAGIAEFGFKNEEMRFSLFVNSEFRIPKSEIGLFFFFEKFVVDGIDEGLPTGLDDIFGNSNGSPF